MNKRNNILIALLLITAGIVINFFFGQTNGSVDIELTDFFSGILLGSGLAILVQILIPPKKTKLQKKENKKL